MSTLLLPHHRKQLEESGIGEKIVALRGYETVRHDGVPRLRECGFSDTQLRDAQRLGLMIPLYDAEEEVWGYQFKPDNPRKQPGRPSKDSKPGAPRFVKYETPAGQKQQLDIPPGVAAQLAVDASRPLIVTEGTKKADAAVSAGYAALALLGVSVWHTEPCQEEWKKLPLTDRPVYVCFDSDAVTKRPVQREEESLALYLARELGAEVRVCRLQAGPDGKKVGLDDYIVAGGDVEALFASALVPKLPDELGERASGDDRPELDVGGREDFTDRLKSIIGTGPLSGIYLRGHTFPELVLVPRIGELGYTDPHPGELDGPAKVHRLTAETLRAYLGMRYWTFRWQEGRNGRSRRDHSSPQGTSLIDTINAARLGGVPNVKRLDGVTHVPLIRRDGSLLVEPGYDEHTRLLYLPDPTLVVPQIPDRPTAKHVAQARDVVLDVLQDFPFVTEHDRVNFVGMMLTPLLRVASPPPYPAGIINAPMPGSGKTLLAEVLRTLYGGVFRPSLPTQEDEIRKSLSSILLNTTATVVQWDNITNVISSAALEALLTSSVWTDRRLGVNEDLDATNDRLWLFTGNNVQIGGDLGRRVFWSSIDPQVPAPERRTGFAHKDLIGYVTDHRSDILGALLTMVRYWVKRGRSRSKVELRSDQYGHWASSVHGVLKDAGFDGEFLHPCTDRRKIGSSEDGQWEELLAAIHDEIGSRPFMAAEVMELCTAHETVRDALPGELSAKYERDMPTGGRSFAISLGRWLQNRDGRYVGDYVVRAKGRASSKNTKLWEITREGDDA